MSTHRDPRQLRMIHTQLADFLRITTNVIIITSFVEKNVYRVRNKLIPFDFSSTSIFRIIFIGFVFVFWLFFFVWVCFRFLVFCLGLFLVFFIFWFFISFLISCLGFGFVFWLFFFLRFLFGFGFVFVFLNRCSPAEWIVTRNTTMVGEPSRKTGFRRQNRTTIRVKK